MLDVNPACQLPILWISLHFFRPCVSAVGLPPQA